jgi:hypothetical protein
MVLYQILEHQTYGLQSLFEVIGRSFELRAEVTQEDVILIGTLMSSDTFLIRRVRRPTAPPVPFAI